MLYKDVMCVSHTTALEVGLGGVGEGALAARPLGAVRMCIQRKISGIIGAVCLRA
jgi:hypothetical protein